MSCLNHLTDFYSFLIDIKFQRDLSSISKNDKTKNNNKNKSSLATTENLLSLSSLSFLNVKILP